MPHFVGLDVSQKTTAICVVDARGRRLWRGVCGTDPEQISSQVARHAGLDAKVGVETGAMTPWLVHGLRAVADGTALARSTEGLLPQSRHANLGVLALGETRARSSPPRHRSRTFWRNCRQTSASTGRAQRGLASLMAVARCTRAEDGSGAGRRTAFAVV